MCIYVYICVYMCIYVCMYVCMYVYRMWDMSTLIRRCENFGHFYNFCSQLVHILKYRRMFVVSRHVNFSLNIVFNDCCLC